MTLSSHTFRDPQLCSGRRVCIQQNPQDAEEEKDMKRTIAGVLLLIAMGAGTMFADDGWRDRRDIRRDEAKIVHDRRELHRDLYYGNYGTARHERRELSREYRDVNRDRRDLYWDRR